MKYDFDKWEAVHEKGKRHYLLSRVYIGMAIGIAIPSSLTLFMRLWIGSNFFERTSSFQLSLAFGASFIGLTLLYIFCAMFDWKENEKRFESETALRADADLVLQNRRAEDLNE